MRDQRARLRSLGRVGVVVVRQRRRGVVGVRGVVVGLGVGVGVGVSVVVYLALGLLVGGHHVSCVWVCSLTGSCRVTFARVRTCASWRRWRSACRCSCACRCCWCWWWR